MCERPRIAHARYYQGNEVNKSSPYDRVITVVWTLENVKFEDGEGTLLTYGGTNFNKDSKTDFWDKRIHRERAMERFTNSPVRVRLLNPENIVSDALMDWYIAQHLVYKFGMYTRGEQVLHVQEVDRNASDYYPWELKKTISHLEQNDEVVYSLNWFVFPLAVGFFFLAKRFLF